MTLFKKKIEEPEPAPEPAIKSNPKISMKLVFVTPEWVPECFVHPWCQGLEAIKFNQYRCEVCPFRIKNDDDL